MLRRAIILLAISALVGPAAADIATRDRDGVLVIQSLEKLPPGEQRQPPAVRNCRVMTCEEAVRLRCRVYTRKERADLVLPCEKACPSKAQADAVRTRIDC